MVEHKNIRFSLISGVLLACLTLLAASSDPVWAQQDPSRARTVELIAATDTSEPTELKRLLEAGYEVNGKFAGGTALHTAIVFGRLESVRLLLQHGADPTLTYDDDTVPGYAGRDALQLAEKLGRPEIIDLVRQAMITRGVADPSVAQAANAQPAGLRTGEVARPNPGRPKAAASALYSPLWEKPERFAVGENVLYSRDRGKTWQRGTVTKITSLDGVPRLQGVSFYQVDDERRVTSDIVDTAFVTTLERQDYWSDFFHGDWNLTLPMVMTERVEGDDLYRIYSGADRLPPLRINVDGTYSWTLDEGTVLRGAWRANEKGPGLVLLEGHRSDNWILYSTSEASERESFKTDTVRLVSESGRYTPMHGFRLQKK